MAFSGGTITSTGGNASAGSVNNTKVSVAGVVNSGQGAWNTGYNGVGGADSASWTQRACDGALITAGGAVTAGATLAITVGAGGTAGTSGAAGGSGYVYLEYQVKA